MLCMVYLYILNNYTSHNTYRWSPTKNTYIHFFFETLFFQFFGRKDHSTQPVKKLK